MQWVERAVPVEELEAVPEERVLQTPRGEQICTILVLGITC
jgi:hypothetical protein